MTIHTRVTVPLALACVLGAAAALVGVVLPVGSAQPGQSWLGGVDLSAGGIVNLCIGYLFCLFVIGWFALRVERRLAWPTVLLGAIWTVALVAGKWTMEAGASPLRTVASIVLVFPFLCLLARDGIDWLDLLRRRGSRGSDALGSRVGFQAPEASCSRSETAAPHVSRRFARRTFLVHWLVIFACWVVMLAALYPACLVPNDTVDQLQQFFGVESRTAQMAGQIEPGVYLNNHHPVLHTLLLGSFVKLGVALGSVEAGLCAFVLLQMAIGSSALASGLAWARCRGARRGVVVACLLAVSLVPHLTVLMCNLSKDGMFTAFFTWVVVLALRIGADGAGEAGEAGASRGRRVACYGALAMCVIGMCLMRSTGIYIVAVALPFLLVFDVRHRRRMAGVCAGCLVVVLVLSRAVFPAFGVAPGNPDEKYAIPLQQIALCYIEHGDEFTPEQRAEVDRVLDADTLEARFTPYNADPVKNTRDHGEASRFDGRTAKLWLELARAYPTTFLRAYLPLVKEYFDPLSHDRALWVHLEGYFTVEGDFIDESVFFAELGIPVHEAGIGFDARVMLEKALNWLLDLAVCAPLAVGSLTWMTMLLACYALMRRQSRLYAPLVFTVLLMATLLLSPALGLVRYGLPLYCAVPLLVAALATRPTMDAVGQFGS